jgi:hypothetical protein
MDEPAPSREATTAPESEGGSFLICFLAAGAPIIVPGLVSLVGNVNSGFALLWFAGSLARIVAFFVMIVLYYSRRPRTGTGVLAALGVGALVLLTTCSANLADRQL